MVSYKARNPLRISMDAFYNFRTKFLNAASNGEQTGPVKKPPR